jgi:hypothetical protein
MATAVLGDIKRATPDRLLDRAKPKAYGDSRRPKNGADTPIRLDGALGGRPSQYFTRTRYSPSAGAR